MAGSLTFFHFHILRQKQQNEQKTDINRNPHLVIFFFSFNKGEVCSGSERTMYNSDTSKVSSRF